MKKLFLLILCLSVAACIPLTPTPAYPDLQITLERTPCFGTCPFYQLTIDGNGDVTYEGKDFVAVEGTRTTRIDSAKVQELVTAFEDANFFSLEDEYRMPATDLPTVITSITLNGRSKRVLHYGLDCRGGEPAPDELCELEQKIDEIVNSDQWVKQK
jgi:hypothetical protein